MIVWNSQIQTESSLLAAIVLSVAAPYINITEKEIQTKLLFSRNQAAESSQQKDFLILLSFDGINA